MRQRVYYRRKRLKEILLDVLANGSDTFARFAERLLDQLQKLFFFTKNTEVECTNNIAERSLRHIVLWRKTSYGTQSEEGSRFIERAISIWMTLKKQGKEIFPFFFQAYQSTYHPKVAAPTI
ncbi:MAG: transposase [Halobacteriovoraceae bacterium]|nr:transposase [Halobacteriovoraceae bacterium]